jgi:hypothetical protein
MQIPFESALMGDGLLLVLIRPFLNRCHDEVGKVIKLLTTEQLSVFIGQNMLNKILGDI